MTAAAVLGCVGVGYLVSTLMAAIAGMGHRSDAERRPS